MLCREFPAAVRIRPSRGDRGVDVLLPAQSVELGPTVVQIKKFATRLNASQRRQIWESFSRALPLLVEEAAAGWMLLMPLDPTPEDLEWFRALPDNVVGSWADETHAEESDVRQATEWIATHRERITWHGRSYCESLVARYPDVVDYYFNGGQQRLRSAISQLHDLVPGAKTIEEHGDAASLISPAELTGHLEALARALDTDPHYRYAIDVAPFERPMPDEPGLVAATRRILPDGRTVTVGIYPRFAEAVNERPIPISVQFAPKPGSADEQALADWRKYGKPFSGSALVRADLPGHPVEDRTEATISVGPSSDNETYVLRYRVRRPDGTIAGPAAFTMIASVGLDRTGSWHRGTAHEVLDVEGTVDVAGTVHERFELHSLAGKPAASIRPATDFAAALASPNRLELAGAVGPFRFVMDLTEADPLVAPPLARYIAALADLQEHTSQTLRVPDFSTLDQTYVHEVLQAGALLNGTTATVDGDSPTARWDAVTFTPDEDAAALQSDVMVTLRVVRPYKVRVEPGLSVQTGFLEIEYESARRDPADETRFVPGATDQARLRWLPEAPYEPNRLIWKANS